MRDFPVFVTEYGVASLILREVPYRQEAYICMQDSQDPEGLLKECVDFCRAVGAERIFARDHGYLERFPLHSIIYRMTGIARPDEDQVASLFPVTKETVGRWRQLMNERMAGVDNSGTLESRGEAEILQSGGAYFVHRDGELLGAFWLREEEIALVAAVKPGAGKAVMHTLMTLCPGESLSLEVVSTNFRAIRLYESLDFQKVAEVRRWYQVYPK